MAIYDTLKIYDSQRKIHLEFDRNRYLNSQVRGKTVLHVGCSDFPITQQRIDQGTLLHSSLQDNAKTIVGIDLSKEGIDNLKKNGFDNVQIMNAEDIKLTTTFDIILAGDVLEHLNNPGLFLRSVDSLMNSGGELIVAVPSALTFNNLKAWFLGWEQVHVDHTFYFSPKTLSELCSRFGLLPTKLIFTVQPAGHTESSLFVFLRKTILKLFRNMSPSFIMHFKNAEDVVKTEYVEWK